MDLHDFLHVPDIPLSFGLERKIAESSQQGSVTPTTLASCALQIWPEERVKEGLADLCERFSRRVKDLSDKAPEPGKTTATQAPPARSLGAALRDWAQNLTASDICLYLADHDPVKAHTLYWRTEATLVEAALKARLGLENARHNARFEATLYGFGGKYADDSPSAPDLSGAIPLDSKEGMEALKAFGFNF